MDGPPRRADRRRRPGGRRAEQSRRRGPGCLIALVVLAVLAGGRLLGVTTGIDKIKDQFERPTTTRARQRRGDLRGQAGRQHRRDRPQPEGAGIVASVDAFIDAARANPESENIQVGFYPLLKEMKAADALAVLVDPANIVTDRPSRSPRGCGSRTSSALLVESTDFPKEEFEKALAGPGRRSGCPAYAEGNPEGYLFPATYDFGPNDEAGRHAQGHGGALAAGRRRRRPRGRRRGAGLHAARDDDDRQPDRGRGPRRRTAQDRPGHLQPARDRPATRRPASCRSTPRVNYALGRDLGRPVIDRTRRSIGRRLAVQHLHAEGPAAGPDRGARRRRRSRPRCTPRTGPGSTTSRSTSRPARPSSPTTTTSSSSTRTSRGVLRDPVRPVLSCADAADEVRRPRRPDRPLAVAGDPPRRLRGARARRLAVRRGAGAVRRAGRVPRRARPRRRGAGCR